MVLSKIAHEVDQDFGDCEGNNIDPSEVSFTFHVGLSFHLERESIRIT